MNTQVTVFETLEKSYSFVTYPRQAQVRIGLVQLATDYTLENDWHQVVGGEVELYSTRLPFCSEMTPDNLQSMERDIGSAAALVATGLEVDVMAYGCTAASMLIGDARVASQLTLLRPGLPATNPWLASITALRTLNARNVAVLAPYLTAVNSRIYDALLAVGFRVSAFGAFQLALDTDIPAIHPDSIAAAVEDLLREAPVDAVFLSCTNLRAMQMLSRLEQQFGIPFVSSNQALLWHALRLASSGLQFDRFGRLLAEH